MPSQKRSRYQRQMSRRRARVDDQPAKPPNERKEAIRLAASARDKQLRELEVRYAPKIADLEMDWAEKRREVWADYEQRKQLISSATLLNAKG